MVQAHDMQTRNLGRNYELHECVDQENKGRDIYYISRFKQGKKIPIQTNF